MSVATWLVERSYVLLTHAFTVDMAVSQNTINIHKFLRRGWIVFGELSLLLVNAPITHNCVILNSNCCLWRLSNVCMDSVCCLAWEVERACVKGPSQ